jgi:hypothetical protein
MRLLVRKKSESRKPRANGPEPEVEADAEAAGEAESETATVAAPTTDNVGDISVEVNVEDLIAQLESESKGGPAADGSARRKIEDILEEKRVAKEIMDIEDFDIGE